MQEIAHTVGFFTPELKKVVMLKYRLVVCKNAVHFLGVIFKELKLSAPGIPRGLAVHADVIKVELNEHLSTNYQFDLKRLNLCESELDQARLLVSTREKDFKELRAQFDLKVKSSRLPVHDKQKVINVLEELDFIKA